MSEDAAARDDAPADRPDDRPGEQLSLIRAAVRARPRAKAAPPPVAAELPVARVVVDVPLPHLDRVFDYAVPEPLSAAARPGTRVRVRFAGQDVDAYVVERAATTDHTGALTPLRRVVSAEPVLTPEVLALCRAVADRYAGSLVDVLRLAVPPRHAAAEKAAPAAPDEPAGAVPGPVDEGPWQDYVAGPAFVARLAAGGSPRAVWTALPGPGWTRAVATAVAATAASGRGSLVVVPDHRDADAVEVALGEVLGPGRHTRIGADLGPAARWTAFLAALRGGVRVVVGTRAAMFAPVADLGLVVLWDDGDDSHAEPHAPYPHAREVLVLRAEQAGAGALLGGWSRTTETALLLADGWARPVEASRAVVRARWPRVVLADEAARPDEAAARAARMPAPAWRAVQEGLRRGSVLVQVPLVGYVPRVACQTCRRPALCAHCHGPLRLPHAAPGLVAAAPECTWCGRPAVAWQCPHCSGRALRASRIGVDRTAEELGRAFPGAKVVVSRPTRTLPAVPPSGAIVLATPGIEPGAPGGYAAAVLLDGDTLLARPDLRAGEEALRRWRAAAALVRPGGEGGLVVVVADPAAAAVEAFLRGDPAHFAARELEERAGLRLPPAVTAATLDGPAAAVASLLAVATLPDGAETLGPVPHEARTRAPAAPARARPAPGKQPVGAHRAPPARATATVAPPTLDGGEEHVRLIVRAPRAARAELARTLHAAAAVRSARREPGAVRVRLDPDDLG
ncbi:primosome assembly protein PriA [Kineosporia sp. R_H_3]|uniref:primosomal protein N' family DNA-binding protein n=1 Tax=Kineosporia sp. R_H_3 TaxID=1961848 RepID=UPI000B4B249C|nr:primosome assembly protein PriA [Kineosporia sp. R_H_3]